jgi:Pyruvate/2-oxoacid:ferredoxin oxidoreductase delta subunit
MRRRTDLDQAALCAAYDAYARSPGNFMETLFGGGPTTLGRTLVHEETLADDDQAELLTFERASDVVDGAGAWAVSLCYCRHKAEHLRRACDAPLEACLTLGQAAEFVIRHGHGRALERGAAREVLQRSRERGLVFIADNVQRQISYVCSCCGCCCMQLRAINEHGLAGAVRTSPALAQIDDARCTGCGRCARRCPVQAIALHARPPHAAQQQPPLPPPPPPPFASGEGAARTAAAAPPAGRRRHALQAVVDERVCLGCGVCHPACRQGALQLARRGERVLTPESTLERVLLMALERDRLQHLLFDEQEGPSLLLLNRLAGAVLRLPPVKRALLGDTLRSRFLGLLTRGGQRMLPRGLEV